MAKKKKNDYREASIEERIFMLKLSVRMLEQSRWPFHEEGKKVLQDYINSLKKNADIANQNQEKT